MYVNENHILEKKIQGHDTISLPSVPQRVRFQGLHKQEIQQIYLCCIMLFFSVFLYSIDDKGQIEKEEREQDLNDFFISFLFLYLVVYVCQVLGCWVLLLFFIFISYIFGRP